MKKHKITEEDYHEHEQAGLEYNPESQEKLFKAEKQKLKEESFIENEEEQFSKINLFIKLIFSIFIIKFFKH